MSKVNINFQYDDLIKIIDYLPVAVGITDLKGNILKINKKSIKLFGYKLNEIPTLSDWQYKVFPDPKYRKQAIAAWKKDTQIYLKNKKEIKPKIFSITTKNNKILQVEISFKITKNIILVIFDDITEKKEIEEELKNSNNFLNDIIKQSPYAIWISNYKGTLIKINQACCDLLNITPNEVIGKYNVLKDNVVKEQGFFPLVKQVFEKGETAKFELKYDSSTLKSLKLKNSKFVILEVTIFPVKNTTGEITNAVIQHIDITEKKLAEEELQNREKHFRSIVEDTEAGYFFIDKNGIIQNVNNAWIKLYKYSNKNEVIGKHFTEIQKTDDVEKAKKFVKEIMNGNKKYITGEFSRKCKDNSIGYHSFSARPAVHFGNMTGIEGFIIDITHQKKAEESLRKSEERFSALYFNMTEGVALHQTIYNKKGKPINYQIIDINPQYEKILNLNRKNVIGKLATEVYGTQEPPYLKEYANVGETGIPYYFETYFSPMKKHFAISVAQLAKGKWATIFMDITERKQSEEALRESEYLLRKSQKVANIGSFIYDFKSKKMISSQTLNEIFGINEEYSKDYSEWFDLVHPDQKEEFLNYYKNQILKKQKTIEKKYRIIRANDHKERWMFSIVEIEFDKNGNPTKLIGTTQDITERKLAEEQIKRLNKDLAQRIFERTAQLESANKELESFTYSVSHDLRAPLRHIHGFLSILEENIGHTLNKENQRIFSIISESTEHMGKLVDSLLSFSRMNKNELYYEEIDMNKLVKNIINDFKPEFQNRNIKFKINKLPKIKGDKILLRQVWQNLISNALKYTNKCKNTLIEINYMQESPNEIIFFVRDNGIGFDINYVNKLFGVFQRLHNSDEYKGIGIGLANVKKIINRHGGNVWAQGKLNKGATFYFSIPKYNKNNNPSK